MHRPNSRIADIALPPAMGRSALLFSKTGSIKRRGRRGQALVESVIVMFFLCIVFFLLFDYARLLLCRTTLDYAASRAARARAVGFNDFMVLKTARLGAMSVSGECLTRINGDDTPSTAALVSRMGSYLQTSSPAETYGILNFELWNNGNLGWSCAEAHGDVGELTMNVWQRQRVFNTLNPSGAADCDEAAMTTLRGQAKIENHYPFYLK